MKLPNWIFVLSVCLVAGLCMLVSGPVADARADSGAPGAVGASGLPADLFVNQAPPDAVGVGDARKGAQEGKAIVMKGRIGGTAQPIANKYAIFLVADEGLPLCKDACADFCHINKEHLKANLATVQVVDNTGRPIKVSMDGMNGLKPLRQVVVRGTVVKKDNNVLIINARNIYVDNKANPSIY